MNLAIITTFGSNSGDNFIYEGFKRLLPNKSFDSVFLINKVDIPYNELYKEFIDVSDVVVICGSPIFYDKCYQMKWQNKILDYCKSSDKKILMLAVGSNFKCSVDGSIIVPDFYRDKNYSKFTLKYRELSHGEPTVRDKYCLEFLRSTGIDDARQIICPSLFAGNVSDNQDERDLVFIIWGNTFWNSDIPYQKILAICKEMQKILSLSIKDKRVIWVCHDFASYKELIKQIDKKDVLFSNNYIDFLKYYARCFFAFSVKVHGTMLLASMGVPSVLLQLDSRASIIEKLDENYVTPSNSIDQLGNICFNKIGDINIYREKIISLKRKYRDEYREMLEKLRLI